MAIIPAEKDFKIVRRSDFPIRLTLKDGNGNAINLSGYSVTAEVYNKERTYKYADWGVTYTNRSTGTIDLKLTDVQTTTFDLDSVNYDIKVTQPNGDESVYLRGRLIILEGYTA
jgi:hypothetical protein|tara:strand:+ start:86 stop:427 length:342 start_codon:yes stop_codon:yes gene_type:complete